MFSVKSKIEIVVRALLIAMILFNALTPTSAKASSPRISKDISKSSSLTHSEPKHGERLTEKISTESNLQIGNSTANLAPSLLTISSTYYVDSVRTTLTQNASGSILYVLNSSGFVVGDEVLVMSMQGTQAGQYETAYVDQVQVNSLQLLTNLQYTYDITAGSVMVQKVPNLGDVTVTSGGNITAHAWNGTTGGVVFFRAQIVQVDIGGKISVSGLGYRGGNNALTYAFQGESYPVETVTTSMQPNGGGGGAGRQQGGNSGGGGGGGYGINGTNAGTDSGINYGRGGFTYGTANLNRLYLGSGGGGGAGYASSSCGAQGGAGGGSLIILAQSITVAGSLEANGMNGGNSPCDGGGGGGGSGGSVYLSATNVVLNANT